MNKQRLIIRKAKLLERRKEESNPSSLEALSVCVSFLITFGLIGWGLNITLPFAPEQRAKWHAQVLGYSLWQIKLNKEAKMMSNRGHKNKVAGNRTFASVTTNSEERNDDRGTIGVDPWGQAYQYTIQNNKHLLFIWSNGPNLRDDTLNNLAGFQDDDVGYVIDLKMRR